MFNKTLQQSLHLGYTGPNLELVFLILDLFLVIYMVLNSKYLKTTTEFVYKSLTIVISIKIFINSKSSKNVETLNIDKSIS